MSKSTPSRTDDSSFCRTKNKNYCVARAVLHEANRHFVEETRHYKLSEVAEQQEIVRWQHGAFKTAAGETAAKVEKMRTNSHSVTFQIHSHCSFRIVSLRNTCTQEYNLYLRTYRCHFLQEQAVHAKLNSYQRSNMSALWRIFDDLYVFGNLYEIYRNFPRVRLCDDSRRSVYAIGVIMSLGRPNLNLGRKKPIGLRKNEACLALFPRTHFSGSANLKSPSPSLPSPIPSPSLAV